MALANPEIMKYDKEKKAFVGVAPGKTSIYAYFDGSESYRHEIFVVSAQPISGISSRMQCKSSIMRMGKVIPALIST